MQANKKARVIDAAFFAVILICYFLVTLLLFYRQSYNYIEYHGRYNSDMLPYIDEILGLNTEYDFPYPILFLTGRFFHLFLSPVMAMALATAVLNVLSAVVIKYYLDRLCIGAEGKWQKMVGPINTIATFSLLFASMLYPVSWLGKHALYSDAANPRYLGVFTLNPYHNATFLAARPFTIPAMLLFIRLTQSYRTDKKYLTRDYFLFSLFLLLSTLAKPSFTLIFVMMAGLYMLAMFFRSKCKDIKPFFGLGLWFIPTFIVLLYQFGGVFGSKGIPAEAGEKGIAFGFATAWSLCCNNIPRAICLAIAFPFVVLVCNLFCKSFPRLLRFAWGLYGVGLFTLLCLYEKGFRMKHLNFSWGYMHGLFFLFLLSLIVLLQNTFRKKQPLLMLGIQWAAFGAHLLFGLDYFLLLLRGNPFN